MKKPEPAAIEHDRFMAMWHQMLREHRASGNCLRSAGVKCVCDIDDEKVGEHVATYKFDDETAARKYIDKALNGCGCVGHCS